MIDLPKYPVDDHWGVPIDSGYYTAYFLDGRTGQRSIRLVYIHADDADCDALRATLMDAVQEDIPTSKLKEVFQDACWYGPFAVSYH